MCIRDRVQTAIVHVDRSYNADPVIYQIAFGMDKSRRILIDPHPCPNQRLIIGTGERIHHTLIRNPRCHKPHIDPALCRHAKGVLHFVIDCQIRREDIHLSLIHIWYSDLLRGMHE